ncbi:hypothetical protein N431DRAFT_389312 [Stipitochalara longipes BDJ]|nr:hypothetical protein N431DRAFT_389312 [Stipitochalara longipes BDJ]
MYPKAWDIKELILAKALNTDSVRKPDLKNRLHNIFLPGRWQVTRDEYEALLPSMRLASHLIEVSMPYLSNFLPSDQLHQNLTPKRRNADGTYSGYTVQLKTNNISPMKLEETRKELDRICESVSWQVNYEMYRTLSWQGITRTVFDAPRPWAEITPEETKRSDARLKHQGHARRKLTIGIMGEYVMALRQSAPGSEAHVRAVFLAAITMTHEIGHAVFQQHFRSLDRDPTQGYEPWVGKDCWAELGLAYIGWIFSGYNPMPCAMGSVDHPWNFAAPLAWFKHFTVDEHPLYETAYSIGVQFLGEILSTEFWDSLGDPKASNFSEAAKRKLKPVTGPAEPLPATAMLPQWKWTRFEGVLWKTKFNDRRAGARPVVSCQEIKGEQDQLKIRYPHTRPTLWNGDPNPRINLFEFEDEDEDKDFKVGPSTKLHTESSLNSLRRADLPPREMDDGFISPDLPDCQEKSTNILLAVRYLPDRILNRAPSGNSKSYINDVNDPERGERFDDEDYDPNDLTAILFNKVDHKIAKITHEQAFKYCQYRKIRFGLDYKDDETWQRCRLDRSDPKEQALIQRIAQHSFRRLEKRFKDSPLEVALIKDFGRAVRDWDDVELIDFCGTYGLSTSGDTHDRMARVRNWMETDFDTAMGALSDRDAGIFTQTVSGYQILRHGDLSMWEKADFMVFFKNKKLPTWGTRDTWEQRLYRFEEDVDAGGKVSRWAINQDVLGVVLRTRNGVEIYRFEANPARTSVAILKTELLVIGMFPSDSNLDLYFGADRRNALDDDKPLSFYEGRSFKDLWLEVRPAEFDDEDSTSKVDKTPIVYEPPAPMRKIKPVKGNNLVQKPDPSLKRTYDIMEGTVAPTITERMQQVGQLASRLTQVTEAGGGREMLHPHLKGRKSTSGAEMLDNLEDLEDLRAERMEALKQALEAGKENEVPSDGEDDGIPRGHESTYMAATYRSIEPHCS